MFGTYFVNVDEGGRWQRLANRVIQAGFRAPYEFYLKTALFLDLSEERLLGIFVQFNVPADGEPHTQLLVPDEQDFAVFDDVDRYDPVYEFVDVRHNNRLRLCIQGEFDSPVQGRIRDSACTHEARLHAVCAKLCFALY